MARNPRSQAEEAEGREQQAAAAEQQTATEAQPAATQTPTQPATPAQAPQGQTAAAAPAAQGADERHVIVNHPETGQPVARARLIQELWSRKISRSDITKILNNVSAGGVTIKEGVLVNTSKDPFKKIPYQIVFAGTKGKQGGPDKQAPVQAATVGTGTAAGTEAAPATTTQS